MRNLKVKYCRQLSISLNDIRFVLFNTNFNNNNNGIQYLVTSDKLYSHQFGITNDISVVTEVPNIVGAEYLVHENSICLASRNGEVLLVNPEDGNCNEGTFSDVGIECMAWSPDQDVVAFVTCDYNVVVMTCNFELLNEHSLTDTNVNPSGQFVNVGWGKKETQFHGSEGKQAATKTLDNPLIINIDQLPKNVEISWRADSSYFTISYLCSLNGRTFKVFNKEGICQYKAEKQMGLSPSIAWRPSGNWIAVAQNLQHKSILALFEKNGLKHREFVLPFDIAKEPIKQIAWSSDSEILAILNTKGLYLYTIANYHWYLKQVLMFDTISTVALIQWDNRIGEEKTLHVILTNGNYFIYKWQWWVDEVNSKGLVAVIDGKRLLLTNFSKTVLPPPMCYEELVFDGECYIVSIAMITIEGKVNLCVCDSNANLHLYQSDATSNSTTFHKLRILNYKSKENSTNFILFCGCLQFLNEMLLLTTFIRNNESYLNIIALEPYMESYEITSLNSIQGIINALTSFSIKHLCEIFYQTLEDRKIMKLTFDLITREEIQHSSTHLPFEYEINSLAVFAQQNRIHSVALTANQHLFVDNKAIETDVTSFYISSKYLILTKSASMHFYSKAEKRLVYERRIEHGGKLITVIWESARCILQMPRGNLELIYPRILSLELIGEMLDSKQYYNAFDILRKQRINLNIICDHNIKNFLANLDIFLANIQNTNWLNLFISDLQNEDFTKGMYSSNYLDRKQDYPDDFQITDKVSYICKKLLEIMQEKDATLYHLPIITAYVKLGQLEDALELIWQQKKSMESSQTAGGNNKAESLAENSLKYLLYLVDVNDLFNVALGTYDFALVVFVAQKSQKDPKEFLAFFNELKTFEVNYRKFKIDEHLKRWHKALEHIAACGVEKLDEALAFIKRHQCFNEALKIYEKDTKCYAAICSAYADHLRSNNKLENASLMYEKAGNFSQALQSAKHILDWRRAIILANKYDFDVPTVAKSLVKPLQDHEQYEESFELLKEFGDNFEDSLRILLKGRLFLKAIYEAERYKAKHLSEEQLEPKAEPGTGKSLISNILEELLTYSQQLLLSLKTDQEQFLTYKTRLLELRATKLAKSKQFEDETRISDIDENDLLSDTSSLHSSAYSSSSRSTGKTFRSSKNRRKHERKLLNLKPGNPFEDIALIDALYNQINNSNTKQQQHIHDTCKSLILLNKLKEAKELQQQYKELLSTMQQSLDDIWTSEVQQAGGKISLQGPNNDYTLWHTEQRYALLEPVKRFKPDFQIINWEHEILF